MREDAHAIVVEGVVYAFGDRVIHQDLDLSVNMGEVLGVVGGSGTGKTVLLNSILGLREPTAGKIRLFGEDTADMNREAREEIEKRWGVLFQQGALFSSLTVLENVSSPLVEHSGLPRDTIREIAELKIAMVGLGPEAHHLDEPTAGLDPIGAAAFDDLIKQLQRNLGLTVFMITHDLDSLYAICDRVAVLADKKVIEVAPPQELERSDHPWIKEYFLGPRGRAAQAARGKS